MCALTVQCGVFCLHFVVLNVQCCVDTVKYFVFHVNTLIYKLLMTVYDSIVNKDLKISFLSNILKSQDSSKLGKSEQEGTSAKTSFILEKKKNGISR